MAEYLANAVQTVELGSPVLFTASIPCPKGYVYHEDETGIFILRGPNNGSRFARYQVTFNGNIAIPEGGAVTPIALAVSENGEARPTSRAIFTPAAVDTYGNVTSTAIITVPCSCCFSIAVRYISGVTDGTTTPTPAINVINSNLEITRIA
jgi:hypothetical protein